MYTQLCKQFNSNRHNSSAAQQTNGSSQHNRTATKYATNKK